MLKPNRTAAAWAIAIPLAALFLARPMLQALAGSSMPSDAIAIFDSIFTSLGFGIAAVWLLAPHLQHRWRLGALVKMLITCAAFGGFACLVRRVGNDSAEVIALAVLIGVVIVALVLSGWICRKKYRPALLLTSSAAFVPGLFVLFTLPFFILSRGNASWGDFFGPVLSVAAGTFLVLLPFLLLAFGSRFFRDRIKALLRLDPATSRPDDASSVSSTFTQPLERTSV